METFKISFKILLFMTLLTGGIYPLLVTGIGQSIFAHKANGSLIIKDNQILGSELIGQNFSDPKYFWGRPSAVEYNPLPSGGSNSGLTSQDLKAKFEERKAKYAFSPEKIPVDLLFASGSGLDPHITPAAAEFQVARIAKARRFTTEQQKKLNELLHDLVEKPDYAVFGENRINVLKLNIALDQNL